MTSALSRDKLESLRLEAGEPVTHFDRAIEWILSGLLVFMPLVFGVVAPWSEEVVAAGALAMCACLVAKHLWRRDASGVWTWAYLPILLFILLALVQMIPLPAGIVKLVSPGTLATHQRLLADMPDVDALLRTLTLSFYPPKTRHDLMIVLIAVAVFVAVLDVYRWPAQIVRLLTVIALVGGAVALLALLQVLTQADSIYWLIPTGYNRATSGTFINYSNYSQFMNLSVGAAVGLLLLKLREGRGDSGGTRPRRGAMMQELGEPAWQPVWGLGLIVGMGMVSVLLSLSRGGVISLMAALAFTTVLVGRRLRLRAQTWGITGVVLAVLIVILYAGFDSLYDRMATFEHQRDPTTGRTQIYKDITQIVRQFPAVGVGLGAHEYVYPVYDRSTNPLYAEHADSDYFQLAEEMGFTGLALMAAFLGMVWWTFFRVIRSHRPRVGYVAFGLGYGLVAVMVHGMTDFGQHLPAVACLSAISCALLFNLGRLARAASNKTAPPAEGVVPQRTLVRRVIDAGAPLLAGLSLCWALVVVNNNRLADADWQIVQEWAADIDRLEPAQANEGYIRLLTAAEAASARVPDNVEYRYGLNLHRWRSISRTTDPASGGVVLAGEALGFTERIVDDLHRTRLLCPTFAPIYSLLGQLEVFVLNKPSGSHFIRQGYELGRTHPTVVFAAGVLDASEGHWDDSLTKFRRCLALDQQLLPEILDVYIRQMERPDLAVSVASDKAEWLVTALYALRTASHMDPDSATQPATQPGDASTQPADASTQPATQLSGDPSTQPATQTQSVSIQQAREALRGATELAKARALADETTAAGTLAAIAGLSLEQNDPAAAITFYRLALHKDYGKVEWHYGLAWALTATQQYEDALKEVRLCLRLRPEMPEATQLMEELINRTTASTRPS